MIRTSEPHFHVITLHQGMSEIIHEIQYDNLGEAIVLFTELVESFNSLSLPVATVQDECNYYLDVQGAIIQNGRIPIILSRCPDRCTVNKSWRN